MVNVKIINGLYKDQTGEIIKENNSRRPFLVQFKWDDVRQRRVHKNTPFRKLNNGFKQIIHYECSHWFKKSDLEFLGDDYAITK